jgi:hypothetical protein
MMRFQNNLHQVLSMLNREKPVMMRFQNNLHLVRSMLNREKPVMTRFQNNLHLVRSMLNREKPVRSEEHTSGLVFLYLTLSVPDEDYSGNAS